MQNYIHLDNWELIFEIKIVFPWDLKVAFLSFRLYGSKQTDKDN